MKIKPEVEATLPNTIVTIDNLFIGAKVMRGPSWSYMDQDGGVGNIGIITREHTVKGGVYVKWHTDKHEWAYCIGHNNRYDLVFAK